MSSDHNTPAVARNSHSEGVIASAVAPCAVMYWDGAEQAITPREKALIEEHSPSRFSIPLVPATEQRACDLEHARAACPNNAPGSLEGIKPPRYPKVQLRDFVPDKDCSNG